jgi:hypothetical protein
VVVTVYVPAEEQIYRCRVEVDFDGGQFRAEVKAHIQGATTVAGEYRIELAGTVRDNLVVARMQTYFGSESVTVDGGFGGEAMPVNDRQPGEKTVYRFSMPTAREDRMPLFVYASAVDGQWGPGRALMDLRLGRTMEVDLAKLGAPASQLSGDVHVTLTPQALAIPGDKPMPTTYTINTRRRGDGYQGRWSCEYGEKIEGQGDLTGSVAGGSDLMKTEAIDRDWPRWNGPNFNFSAENTGHALVDSLTDARLVWRSEKTPPGRCQTTRYGDGNIKNFLTRGGPAGQRCSGFSCFENRYFARF